MTRREPAVVPRESATGAIYDLGYRRYDGPRLGRRAAVGTLFRASLRAAFGLGRGARSKIVPWGLTAIVLAPAVVAAAVAALVPGGFSPIRYENVLWGVSTVFALFVAAQAPELVSSDQRHRVLSLYFSHALERSDYAFAKLGALAAAIFIVALAPMLVLFLAAILVAPDVPKAFGDELRNLPQVLVTPVIYAVPLAALGLAIAAYTPRRAFATGAIIAVFIVTGAVAGILGQATSSWISDWAQLASPFVALDGARDWLVGGANSDAPVRQTGIALWVFGAEALAIALAGAAVVWWRYRRVAA